MISNFSDTKITTFPSINSHRLPSCISLASLSTRAYRPILSSQYGSGRRCAAFRVWCWLVLVERLSELWVSGFKKKTRQFQGQSWNHFFFDPYPTALFQTPDWNNSQTTNFVISPINIASVDELSLPRDASINLWVQLGTDSLTLLESTNRYRNSNELYEVFPSYNLKEVLVFWSSEQKLKLDAFISKVQE
jgi:hypothetical protein